jgi:hypothetical protein
MALCLLNDADHIVDLQARITQRILREPFRGQEIGCGSHLPFPFSFTGDPQENMRNRRHGRDPVFDRKPRFQVGAVQRSLQ